MLRKRASRVWKKDKGERNISKKRKITKNQRKKIGKRKIRN